MTSNNINSLDLDEDDVYDLISEEKMGIFRSRFSQLPIVTDSVVSGISLRIIEIFNRKKGQKDIMQQWLEMPIETLKKKDWNRIVIDKQIDKLGHYRKSSDPRDQKKDKATTEFIQVILKSDPNLPASRTLALRRSLFHEAAIKSLCDIIRLCSELILEIKGSIEGGILVSQLIMEEDDNGKSALYLAVEFGDYETLKCLLSMCNLDDQQAKITSTLLKAVELRSLKMLKALLRKKEVEAVLDELEHDSNSDEERDHYRTNWIELAMLNTAIIKGDKKILAFLVYLRPEILEQEDCTCLHDAVQADLEDIVKLLLDKYPQLATRLRTENTPGTNSQQDGNNIIRRSALSLVQKTTSGDTIKSHVLPVLMRLLPISAVRDHLEGGSWNEIYLDLSHLRHHNAFLTAFLQSVQNELGPKDDLDNQNEAILIDGDSDEALNVQFETALKYVEIPLFDNSPCGSRTEATSILTWLKLCKQVGHIYEVRVEDSLQNPHSEENIENALIDLNVRSLDWRRVDLSIYTILASAPNVEKLHLYSSGNLAAIDHWLGNNGTSTLTKLNELHITVINDMVSPERALHCETKITQHFAAGIHSVTPQTKIQSWQTAAPKPPPSSNDSTRKRGPVSVVDLEYFLQNYKIYQDERNASQEKTKVAILDTGINRAIFQGRGHATTGASFVHRDPGENERASSWWLAPEPHGSYVANIISQLDPRCELYIAQIAAYKDEISIQSVVNAFKWAISQKVQIINCSFALFKKHDDLQKQISAAATKGILVICSTADEGYIRQDAWPAKYHSSSFSNVIPIAACDSKGKLTGYSSKTFAKYRLQGEQVDAADQEVSLKVTNAVVSGSSVATAMATGIASLVLACENILHVYSSDPVERNSVQVVDKIFHEMCAPGTREDPPPFITPSLVFPNAKGYFRDTEHFQDWIVTGGFARKLNADTTHHP